MTSGKTLACQLCRNEFPQRQKVVKQVKCLLGGKRVHVNRLTWEGSERDLCPLSSLNHFYGAFLPVFLWPIIFLCLVLSPYLVYLRVLPFVRAYVLAKIILAKMPMGKLTSPTMGWRPLPF